MADGTTIIVNWIVHLKVKLRTIAGFVHIAKPVECLIIPGDSGEFLLGNDLLLSLDIDVDRKFDMLAVPFGADTDGDEFDEADEPTVDGAKVQDSEVRAAVLELVDKANREGFPGEWKEELVRVAMRFDLWRIRLGADPPA
ncbi:unnamed protein product [Phytophthora lilii]|uniref:Unnamed protein product n=1 Tax=Phytophthora lilii TaxID=2077276 RepID=A0A9W7D8L2_9STRA|nr:unnamed protein product [Phytophthora lilii]